jgi:hypothetical protein
MAIPQTKQFPVIRMREKSYLTVLIIIMLLGTMVAAFDAVARGIALPLVAADLHFSTFFCGSGNQCEFSRHLLVQPCPWATDGQMGTQDYLFDNAAGHCGY